MRTSNEDPQSLVIPALGSTIADYHRNLKQGAATEAEISQAKVVYVLDKKNRELPHLSHCEGVGSMSPKQGQGKANQVFNKIKEKPNLWRCSD